MMPPCPPLCRAAPAANPYHTLGVSSNASPAQIKSAYRALALQYHPDRRRVVKQRRRIFLGGINTVGDERSGNGNDDNDDDSCKFATIAEAYAILSDTARKAEYDRMRRLGAFDDDDDNNSYGINITGVRGTRDFGRGRGGAGNETIAKTQQQQPDQRYVQNLSGGYIKPGYVPPQQSSSRQPSRPLSPFISSAMNGFSHHYQQNGTTSSASSRNKYHSPTSRAEAVIQNLQSQDSFMDDLQRKQQSTPKKRTGIGFSFVPPQIAGAQSYLRHQLSIHVPSRTEIMANIVKGDGVRNSVNGSSSSSRRRLHHLFGTKVTFSSQQTTTSTMTNNYNNTATKLDERNQNERRRRKIDNNVNNKGGDDGERGGSCWYDKLEMLILGACGATASDLICGTGNGGKGDLSDEHNNSNNNVFDDDDDYDDIVNENDSVTSKDVLSPATNVNGSGDKVVKSYTTRISGGRRRIITHTARIIDEQPSSLLLSDDNGGDRGGMTTKKKVEIEVAEDGVVRHKYWYTKEEENNHCTR